MCYLREMGHTRCVTWGRWVILDVLFGGGGSY